MTLLSCNAGPGARAYEAAASKQLWPPADEGQSFVAQKSHNARAQRTAPRAKAGPDSDEHIVASTAPVAANTADETKSTSSNSSADAAQKVTDTKNFGMEEAVAARKESKQELEVAKWKEQEDAASKKTQEQSAVTKKFFTEEVAAAREKSEEEAAATNQKMQVEIVAKKKVEDEVAAKQQMEVSS